MARLASRRIILALVVAGANLVACGLAFEPGDYTWHVPDASTDGTTTGDGGGPGDDGGSPDGATGSHLLVLATERDVTAGSGATTETNDTWIADVDAKGDIVRWSYAQPAPYRGRIRSWTIADGRLWIIRQQTGSNQRTLEFAPFANGLSGTWKGAVVVGDTFNEGPGSLFYSSHVYAFGGSGFVQVDGSSQYQYTNTIRLLPFSSMDVAFDASVTSPTTLPATMRETTVVAYKDFVYLVGGEGGQTSQQAKVRVAKLDPNPAVGVGAFTELPDLKNPATNQPYSVQQPSACVHQGMLYILGGASSDIVLGGKIDESNGTIASWIGLTKLLPVLTWNLAPVPRALVE
jgi:hypothetical protein